MVFSLRAMMQATALAAALAALCAAAPAQPASEPTSQPASEPASQPTSAAGADMHAVLKAMLDYQADKKTDAIDAVAELVKTAQGDVRTQLVDYFGQVLAGNKIKSTLDCKKFVCRQLGLIGTAEAVNHLAKAMDNDDLFGSAVQALNAAPVAQSSKVLRAGLSRFKGRQLISLIDSAGRRRDEEAIDALLKLVTPDNDPVLAAAIAALSRIATPDAATALVKAYAKAPHRYRSSVAQARLRIAREMVAAGKIDAAMDICEQLTGEDAPVVLRLAALHGLASTAPTRAAIVTSRLLTNSEPALAAKARELARSMAGSAVTEALGRDMKDLDAAAQTALLAVLVERNDPAARSAIMAAAAGDHPSARLAAVKALASLGDAACVPMLAEMTGGTDETLAAAARATFRALQGRAVDQAIIWAIKPAKSNVKVELFRCLADRKTDWAVPELLAACTDEDELVRSEAFRTLGAVAEGRYLPMLVRRMLAATGPQDRPAAEAAVALCARRSGDLDKAVLLIAKSLAASEDLKDRCSLLHAIGAVGGAQALKLVHAAQKDPNDQIRDAATQALIHWPDSSVLDDLIEIINNSPNDEQHAQALRGYLRQAGALRRDNPPQALDMYRRALMMAKRDDEKRQALSDLAEVPSVETLSLVCRSLADQALQSQAAASTVVICKAIARRHRHEAADALQAVLKTKAEGRILVSARELLTDLERAQNHILSWKIAGPFSQEGKGPTELFDIPFPPETNAPALWRAVTAGGDQSRPWAVDLGKAVDGAHKCTAYLRTSIYSPADRDARLETGSDDGIKAWVNGQQVIAANSRRGISIEQDHATIKLTKGWNVLLLKVTQADGDFAACARIRGTDNKPIEGLRENADLP
ncbi:MAG: HEAT repeat domain-containing protein [Planctomycetaceae bacterium]|nr:HEAT repeat domain-containing protein [Planctomycetaceae bacterium]